MNRGFRVVRPEVAEKADTVADASGRFEAFECGFSRGRFRTREQAIKQAVVFWGGYVIDRETGEQVV